MKTEFKAYQEAYDIFKNLDFSHQQAHEMALDIAKQVRGYRLQEQLKKPKMRKKINKSKFFTYTVFVSLFLVAGCIGAIELGDISLLRGFAVTGLILSVSGLFVWLSIKNAPDCGNSQRAKEKNTTTNSIHRNEGNVK